MLEVESRELRVHELQFFAFPRPTLIEQKMRQNKIFYCRSINFASGEKSNRSLGKWKEIEDGDLNSFYCCCRRISRPNLLSSRHSLPFVFDLIIIYDYIEKASSKCPQQSCGQATEQTDEMFYRIRRRRRWINSRVVIRKKSRSCRICSTWCCVQWSFGAS